MGHLHSEEDERGEYIPQKADDVDAIADYSERPQCIRVVDALLEYHVLQWMLRRRRRYSR